MTQTTLKTTWDGQPISPEPPYGAAIVVYRRVKGNHEFLILHRAHRGPDYEGDWAWTPPSGARLPGETLETGAIRELKEEAGLSLKLQPTDCGLETWYVFMAEATLDDQVTLIDVEHDRYEWLPLEQALARCCPEKANQNLRGVGQLLGLL